MNLFVSILIIFYCVGLKLAGIRANRVNITAHFISVSSILFAMCMRQRTILLFCCYTLCEKRSCFHSKSFSFVPSNESVNYQRIHERFVYNQSKGTSAEKIPLLSNAETPPAVIPQAVTPTSSTGSEWPMFFVCFVVQYYADS